MTLPQPRVIDILSTNFKCTRCGYCCFVGGDFVLSTADVERLVTNCPPEFEDKIDTLIIPVPGSTDRYVLSKCRPCPFLDVESHNCLVYDHRPDICRKYPFEAFRDHEIALIAVSMCPGASRVIGDML